MSGLTLMAIHLFNWVEIFLNLLIFIGVQIIPTFINLIYLLTSFLLLSIALSKRKKVIVAKKWISGVMWVIALLSIVCKTVVIINLTYKHFYMKAKNRSWFESAGIFVT